MHKGFLRTAAILAALAVALGAFAAHSLEKAVSDYAVGIFKTGATYQFFHAIALALSGILFLHFPNKLIKASGVLFIVGIIFFCGSLYAITYYKGMNVPMPKFLGPVTPFGGLFFIAGWVCMAFGIKKSNQ